MNPDMGMMARGQDKDFISGDKARLGFAVAALVVGNLSLAFGPLFVRMADTGPVASAFWRMALATPLLFLVARVAGQPARRLSAGMWVVLAASGVMFAADLAAWHLGIVLTKLANANLLGNAAAFLLPLYAFFTARSWPTRTQGVALGLAGAGAALLLGRSFELSPQNFLGDLLCIVAGISYTAYLVIMARVREDLAPLPALAWSTLMSVLPLLLLAVLMGETIIPHLWTPLLLLTFFSQILGQGLMIYALGKVAPILYGITLLLQPMVAAMIGWLAYGERLGPADWVGTLLIALALVLVRRI
jgi:drug/metabolite transporter (DMT)-like permease